MYGKGKSAPKSNHQSNSSQVSTSLNSSLGQTFYQPSILQPSISSIPPVTQSTPASIAQPPFDYTRPTSQPETVNNLVSLDEFVAMMTNVKLSIDQNTSCLIRLCTLLENQHNQLKAQFDELTHLSRLDKLNDSYQQTLLTKLESLLTAQANNQQTFSQLTCLEHLSRLDKLSHLDRLNQLSVFTQLNTLTPTNGHPKQVQVVPIAHTPVSQ